MPKVITTKGKRPETATPERALDLVEAGYTHAEIGRMWNVSRQRIGQLVEKARKRESFRRSRGIEKGE